LNLKIVKILFIAAAVSPLFNPPAAFSGSDGEVRIYGNARPGGLILGRVPEAEKVLLDGAPLDLEDGFFTAGFDRDEEGKRIIEVLFPDNRRYRRELFLEEREYHTQHVRGLQDRHVVLRDEDLERVISEREEYRRALKESKNIQTPYYRSGFIRPVLGGRITGVFGSVRILDGVKGRPHNGIDIALPEGTPVKAMGDGRVLLTGDFFYNGRFVMLGHGHGLVSLYLHLSTIEAEEGAEVRKGDKIGEVGMTGRATGPHLHWGVQWGNRRIDPALLLDTGFASPEDKKIRVSVSRQRLFLYEGGEAVREYPVSTAKKGTGNRIGSYRTPLGLHRVSALIGDGAESGTVFVGRRDTGRVAEIHTDPVKTGEDAITTRILRLEGLEPGINRGGDVDTFRRYIYIHGTHEEGLIGSPASRGCIRMRNRDVIELFDLVDTGTLVKIEE